MPTRHPIDWRKVVVTAGFVAVGRIAKDELANPAANWPAILFGMLAAGVTLVGFYWIAARLSPPEPSEPPSHPPT